MAVAIRRKRPLGSDNIAVFGAFDGRLVPAGRLSGCVTQRRVTGYDRVVASARRAVDVREIDVLDGGFDSSRAGPGERAAAEQVPVEVFTKHATDKVQRHRVHARVDKAQAEADDAERVPIIIVHVTRVRVKVEPHHEHVVRKEADHEYNYK